MSYSFSSLSPADFEDLARELIGEELGCRFDGFCAGPDGGIDGRHSVGKRSTILQAKHFVGSSYSSLKAAIKRELRSIRRLKPNRYILATTRGLTPANIEELTAILRRAVKHKVQVFGPEDLNTLLRKFPDVEKAHIKLWLSSAAVLDKVIRSGAHSYTAIARDEVEAKVEVYAPNPSFKEARDKLEKSHVVIISGPPGVGKTTLAEMLSYAYVGEEWQFIAIRNLDDGFGAIVDAKKQIFFFDDFLGKVALDERALSSKDSELAKFIRRIQRAPNARFILTTRAYIFEEARRASEYLADGRLDIMKYVLDVGIYTRRIRARILYNHLYVYDTPKPYIRALLNADALPSIIDHPNYNPRIIEWMTDALNVKNVPAKSYARAFLKSLDDPARIWDTAFRSHIPTKCQNLLFALFFCPEYGVELESLKAAFDPLHSAMCKKYGQKHSAKDFSESLKILEGSFIVINDGSVSFINPSVRDYLTSYLNDTALLSSFASTAQSARWARELWTYYKQLDGIDSESTAKFAKRFVKVAQRFSKFPVWKRSRSDPRYLRLYDESNTTRLELLLEWWDATHLNEFASAAITIARNPTEGFSAWLDGEELANLVKSLKGREEGDFPHVDSLCESLESGIIGLLDSGISPDDLLKISDSVDEAREYFSLDVFDAIGRSINYNIDEAEYLSAQVDSESTLDDHLKSITALAPRANIETNRLKQAQKAFQSRKNEISEQVEESEEPTFSGEISREKDKFNDKDLRDLFELLVSQ